MEVLHGRYGMMDKAFWRDKKVLITGHTGFKGGWCALILQAMGARVQGYALNDYDPRGIYVSAEIGAHLASECIGDILDEDTITAVICDFKPEIIIHMAAQPIVKTSINDPRNTIKTNVIGAVNLLEACRQSDDIRAIVNVTSDKCYLNEERQTLNEACPLGGKDPYSASKASAEIITSAYYSTYFEKKRIGVATARAGNVIGGGDFTTSRLIPDYFDAVAKNSELTIRNPKHTRPWQHVLEPVYGYLLLAQNLYSNYTDYSRGWNFGPDPRSELSVVEVIEYLQKIHHPVKVKYLHEDFNEAGYLSLCSNLAYKKLKWQPKWDTYSAMQRTVDWMRLHENGEDLRAISLSQIREFLNE